MSHASLAAEASPADDRALFLHSPVGGGHLHASRALAEAWRGEDSGLAIQQIDYLQFLSAWERRLWPGLYDLSVRHWPALWRNYRRWTNRPSEPSFVRNRVTDVGVDRFAALLEATRPRLVVSTIGGAAALAGAAREKLGRGRASFLNALVMTDFRGHRHWARSEADLLFVAGDRAKEDLMAHGIAAERIFVTGIPIPPPRRRSSTEKALLRARLGLGDDPVVLVSSGARSGYRALERLLSALVELKRPMDIVTTGGPATDVERIGPTRLLRLGYRADFCDWISASDLVVGKLGGLTAAQVLATGVPLVVFDPVAGQEEDNARWAVAAGAALWPRSRRAVQQVVADLLYSDAGLVERRRMSQAARVVARPDAAASIARILNATLEVLP